MAKPNAQSNVRPVTFTPEQLRQVIAQAIAEHDAAKAEQAKSDNSAEMDRACTKAFIRAGFKAEDVQPRTNVLTYNRWIEAGRKVREGEKSIRVKNLRLFHVSQTEPITAKQKASLLAERAAKIEAKGKPAPAKPAPVAAKPVKGRGKTTPAAQQPAA